LTEDHPEFEAAAAHRLFKRETFFDQMVTIWWNSFGPN
jgi:hypothetical protein